MERQAGNWENWGPWVSGHPGAAPRTVWKVGVRQRSQVLGRMEGLGTARVTREVTSVALCPGPRHTLG